MKKLIISSLFVFSIVQLNAMDSSKMELEPIYINDKQKDKGIKPSKNMLKLMDLVQEDRKVLNLSRGRIGHIKHKEILNLLDKTDDSEINYQDENGNTLLHLFLTKWLGNIIIYGTHYVLDNQTDRFYSIIDLIMKKGFDINLQDKKGNTISHLTAARNYNSILYEFVRKYKPNLDILNNNKNSVYDLIKVDSGVQILMHQVTKKFNVLLQIVKELTELQKDRKE